MKSFDEPKKVLEGLQNQPLWQYFYDITRIPRESGNEKQMRQYLVDFALLHGFSYHIDQTGNLILYCPATKGMESLPSVALQGHMDMVCVKDEGVDHDFATDPIILVRDGDWLKALGTTLGADNGVALALILDLFSDKKAQHGPLEAIFTVEEETGLTGAFGLDASKLNSRLMINLDSEDEGTFYIGCAGGIESSSVIERDLQTLDSEMILWEVAVDGLSGGHSGAEIHKQRGNAIAILARALKEIAMSMELHIVSLTGGTKRNVIPSTSMALVAIPQKQASQIFSLLKKVEQEVQKELAYVDDLVRIIGCQAKSKEKEASSLAVSTRLINALLLAPHGVYRMSSTIEGMVETSSNLAIINTTEKAFEIISSHRSALACSRDFVANRSLLAFETAGGSGSLSGGYPAWTPDINSPIAKHCAAVWEKTMDSKAVITAIHAGLECGIINSLVEGMDSVSFGPNMKDVHSTAERLSISSTEKLATFLRQLLLTIGS
ncbi:MAG: beta-Ala-His dipeptidase [Sphaerochaetaceae bacterium]|jgi:dipeptidase D